MDSLVEQNGTDLFGTEYSWNRTERFLLERMNYGTERNGFLGTNLFSERHGPVSFGTVAFWNGTDRNGPVHPRAFYGSLI